MLRSPVDVEDGVARRGQGGRVRLDLQRAAPSHRQRLRHLEEGGAQADGGGDDHAGGLLLARGANPALRNNRGTALALHLAARYNKDPSAIEVLIEADKSLINETNAVGNTPLHEAAYEGRVRNAETLLNAGARLDVANSAVDPTACIATEPH